MASVSVRPNQSCAVKMAKGAEPPPGNDACGQSGPNPTTLSHREDLVATVVLIHLPWLCLPPGHNLVKDVTVVETNYTDYALVVKHKVFNREYTQVALYGETGAHTHKHFCDVKTKIKLSRVIYSSLCVCACVSAGRSTAVRPTILDRFRSFAVSQGFPRDSILTPPPAGQRRNCTRKKRRHSAVKIP